MSASQTLAEIYFTGQSTPGLHQSHIVIKNIISDILQDVHTIVRSVSLLLWGSESSGEANIHYAVTQIMHIAGAIIESSPIPNSVSHLMGFISSTMSHGSNRC